MTVFDAAALPAFEPPEYGDFHYGERPPLRGTTSPPAGLHDVDWAALEDAYGTADRTPLFIEALTSDDEGDQNFGVYGLYSATTHQGSGGTAARAAIPFLGELVRRDDEMAVFFLSRIAFGETYFVQRPDDVAEVRGEYADDVAEYLADIEAMWSRTGDDHALRLLVLLGRKPARLPALTSDAGLCLAHGFLAARFGAGPELAVAARELMTTSPSLYVRGAAAACLVYSGTADDDALALLHHLAQGEYPVHDAWTSDLAELAGAAWAFGTGQSRE